MKPPATLFPQTGWQTRGALFPTKNLLLLLLFTALAASPARAVEKTVPIDLENEMPADVHRLKIGDSAPDFSLMGIDGKTYSLADFKDAPVLLVVFLSNHCPSSHAAETRLLPLYAELKAKGLAMIAINPNSPAGLDIGELGYSKYNDSLPEMKLYAADRGFTFPYVYDGDTQKTAKAYGCICTPHLFLFDRERKLRYMGRLDDSSYPEANTVAKAEGADAIRALLAGKSVPVAVTKPRGCATKWIEKKAAIAQINEKWENTPVTIAPIDAAGVAALVKNDTRQLRLINVWATWCVPCVEEFPNLVTLTRQLQTRDFEMITISIDRSTDQAKALRFLQKQHAALPERVKGLVEKENRTTDNYLFTGRDDALPPALDSEWPGPVPYTLIVAPGGKILYRHVGAFDLTEVRAKLIDQLGEYYIPAAKR